MKLLGHAAGGYITSLLVTKRMKLTKPEMSKLLVLGTISGTIPDWDYLWYAFQKRSMVYGNDFRHHTWITHTFPFYWVIAGIIYQLGKFNKSKQIQNSAAAFAAGTTIHLVQDMIGSGDGIMILYPFSKIMKGIGLLNVHGAEWEKAYTKSPVYLVELGIIFTALIFFLSKLFPKTSGRESKK